jgi:hypothetical protein
VAGFCEKWNASQASLEEVSLPRSTQSIQAGVPSKEWKEQLAKLEKSQAIERLWKKDVSLWPSCESRKDAGKSLLDWLELSNHLEASTARVSELGDHVPGWGFTDIVFLAISSSSLAAELISSLALPTRGTKFHVLSRIEPGRGSSKGIFRCL